MPRKNADSGQFRFITPGHIRLVAQHNRGSYLDQQVLLLLDSNADNTGAMEIPRPVVCHKLACRPKSATDAVHRLVRLGVLAIESDRGKTWRLRIRPIEAYADPFLLEN